MSRSLQWDFNALLGDILTAMGKPDEARAAYQKALPSAKTIEPTFQIGWVSSVEKKLGAAR